MYDEKSLQGIGNKIKLLRTLRAAILFKSNLDVLMRGSFHNEVDWAAEGAAGSYSSEEVRLLLKMLQVSKSK